MVAILLVVLGATVTWILRPPVGDTAPRPGQDTARTSESEGATQDPTATAVTSVDRTAKRPPPSHFAMAYGERTRRQIPLVALDHHSHDSAGMHFVIAAKALPTDEALIAENGTRYSAVTWERRTGLVLLLGPKVTDAWLRPVTIRNARELDSSTPVAVVRPGDPNQGSVRFEWFGDRMRLDPGARDGGLLLDADGRGIALVHDGSGLPLQAIAPWRDYWNGQPITKIQREIRSSDPAHILTDARALLAKDTATIERAERALALLEQGQHLARDRAAIRAFDRMIRFAHRQRVRLLSEVSGIRALQQARASLQQLGADAELLRDTLELSIAYGDPLDTLALHQQLLARSGDHARTLQKRLARKMASTANDLMQDNRNEAARQLLAATVRNLPNRADLRMLHAKALYRLGDQVGAQAEANEAARLDRSYAKLARGYASSARKRRIEVPYDKRKATIEVSGAVGSSPIRFLVDTGASYSTIPTAMARGLGLLNAKNPIVTVTTASGQVRAQQVQVPVLTIAKRVRVRRVTAVVMDLPGNLSGMGLLGLDVLSKLNMKIDAARGRLILTPTARRGRR